MDRNDLIKKFNSSISGKKHMDAKRVIENDLIASYDILDDEYTINLKSSVISDSLMSSYDCKLEIEKESFEVISSYCTCDEYEKFEFSKRNYCCKHLIATFYNSINDIIEKFNKKDVITNNNFSILDILENEESKQDLRFEVFIEKNSWNSNLKAYFKLNNGLKSYVIKDIEQFLVHYYNKIPLQFGKDLLFDINLYDIGIAGRKIISFVEILNEIDLPNLKSMRSNNRLVNGKFLSIPDYLVKIFFNSINEAKVYLCDGFYSRDVEAYIINDIPPIDLYLNGSKDIYELSFKNIFPRSLNSNNDVFRIDNYIYIPNDKFIDNIAHFQKAFENERFITFDSSKENVIFRYLLPRLKRISNLKVNDYINERVIDVNPEFCFYLDSKRGDLSIILKVKYNKIEFNIFDDYKEKFIFRREKLEDKVIALLNRLGFKKDVKGNSFIFSKEEEDKFNFFKFDIHKLQKEGAVYYSDKVKGIKKLSSKSFNTTISPGKNNYFDFEFSIDGLTKNEIYSILKSMDNNIRYYKLKDGEFIDLESIELKSYYNLLESLVVNQTSLLKESKLSINNGKAFLLDNILKESNFNINGVEHINNYLNSFSLDNEIAIPSNLKANLREYQSTGLKWMKKISSISGGFILADEMGLGKTLQTIAFLCSEIEECKSLKATIIVPTSLVYNWENELKKFSNLKYNIAIGEKSLREAIVKDFKDNNVNILITTYGTLRNDVKLYKDINHDILIIDEGQNIKNSKAISTKTVKSLKSNKRIILTGTPLENSVNEMWSLFDFVIPGFLGKETNFNARYNKNLKESEEVLDELKSLTKPFILRRYKKDVIKELPEKILKDIFIPLDKENKKMYGIYSKNIQSLINEKKGLDDDITENKLAILAAITKLRQLCLDPKLVIDDYRGNSNKIDTLTEIVKDKLYLGHKVLIFSQFTSALKNISSRFNLEDINYTYLDGSLSAKSREKEIKSFKTDDTGVFLISTKAGGTGLNLTEADIVIHFDPWWNPAIEDQATDRAHRFGQKNSVEVIRLIIKDSIEEKIIELQNKKRDLINSVVNSSSNNLIEKLDFNEVLEILKSRYA